MSLHEAIDVTKPIAHERFTTPREIIRQVMLDRLIDPTQFFSRSKDSILVSARMEVAKELRRRGYSLRKISILLKRNESTIGNYLYSKARQTRHLRYASARGVMVKIHPEYVKKLQQLADLTDTSIEAIVNQAISDTLEAA